MPLAAGTRLGPYEIAAALGAGGMGEVYRARDTRLGRDVAVKILPQEFSADPKRRARFEVEAKAASALQHSGIIVVYDIGEQHGLLYMVTELIDGQTLRETIEPGALPVRKVIDLASQVADALAAAHAAAIVHRDLKPDNVMITSDGRAKILDFGLAKTPVIPSQDDATIPAMKTDPGMILGTIGYMSPEQVRAAPTDARSDIFSFGTILYEMLSGKRAFDRPTAAESMTAILREDVEPLPAEIPQGLARVVERCLEKEPKRRFQSTGDLAFAIRNSMSQASIMVPAPADVAPPRWRMNWIVVGAVAVASVLAGWLLPRSSVARAPVELTIVPPKEAPLAPAGSQESFTLSADGTAIVYRTSAGSYVRRLDSLTPTLLADSKGGFHPLWSPDGQSVAFTRPGELIKHRLSDGSQERVKISEGFPRGGTWSSKGVILIGLAAREQSGLLAVMPDGRNFLLDLGQLKGETIFWPEFLPDGEHFLFSCCVGRDTNIYLARLRDGKLAFEPVALRKSESTGHYTPSGGGRLLYLQDDNLYAQQLDLGGRKLVGEPQILVRSVASSEAFLHPYFHVSRTGVIAWRAGSRVRSQLTWFDRSGNRLSTIGKAGDFRHVRMSPDGRSILAVTGSGIALINSDGRSEIEVKKGRREFAEWLDSGRFLVNHDDPGKGASVDERSISSLNSGREILRTNLILSGALADGSVLLRGPDEISIVGPGAAKPAPALQSAPKGQIFVARLSPDGRWILFAIREDRVILHAQPIGADGLRKRLGPGGQPVWRVDGKEILYHNDGAIWSVVVTPSGTDLHFGEPHKLFDAQVPAESNLQTTTLAVSPDGSRILFSQTIVPPGSDVIHVRIP